MKNKLAALILSLLAIAFAVALILKTASGNQAAPAGQGAVGAQPITLATQSQNRPTPIPRETVTISPGLAVDSATPGPDAASGLLGSTIRVPVSSFYWGAQLEGSPLDTNILAEFERVTGRRLDIIHWGHAWAQNGQEQDFPVAEMDAARAHGSIALLDWATWDRSKGINQPDYRLADVYSGKYDQYVRKWALAAKDWGHPFFLRFNHEMNGWWFPWSESLNGNKPGDYVKAWRHVHDIFASAGATNVVWVWSPNVLGNPRLTPLEEIYPGDAYVDWVAMDGFNWGSDNGSYWQTFADVFQYTYDQLASLVPDKPFMIAEVASSEAGGPSGSPASKAAWIRDMFTDLPNFPRVKAVMWFNTLDGHQEYSWLLTSSPDAIQAFRDAKIQEPQFSTSAQQPNQP